MQKFWGKVFAQGQVQKDQSIRVDPESEMVQEYMEWVKTQEDPEFKLVAEYGISRSYCRSNLPILFISDLRAEHVNDLLPKAIETCAKVVFLNGLSSQLYKWLAEFGIDDKDCYTVVDSDDAFDMFDARPVPINGKALYFEGLPVIGVGKGIRKDIEAVSATQGQVDQRDTAEQKKTVLLAASRYYTSGGDNDDANVMRDYVCRNHIPVIVHGKPRQGEIDSVMPNGSSVLPVKGWRLLCI